MTCQVESRKDSNSWESIWTKRRKSLSRAIHIANKILSQGHGNTTNTHKIVKNSTNQNSNHIPERHNHSSSDSLLVNNTTKYINWSSRKKPLLRKLTSTASSSVESMHLTHAKRYWKQKGFSLRTKTKKIKPRMVKIARMKRKAFLIG
jgi:hypothetical protein